MEPRRPSYRDDRLALEHQKEALAERLAEAEEQLREKQAALDARETELARLRSRVDDEPPAPVVGGFRKCARCDRDNEAHYKFCLGCGAELGGAPLALSPTPVSRNELVYQHAPVEGGAKALWAGLLLALLLIGVAIVFLLVF